LYIYYDYYDYVIILDTNWITSFK